MPTQFMREEDRDFALVSAVPLTAEGVVQIFGRQTNDDRKFGGTIDAGNPDYGLVGGETLLVFDNVFVPWDRVFMCGETGFAGLLVERFATLHRQNYGGCKGGVSDVIVGACAVAAEMQGTDRASHIREKLAEMMHLTETLYSGSVSCSAMGQKTPSGAYYPDPLLANCTKHNVTRHVYEIARLAHDVAGGILATMPFESDLKSPEIGKYVEKYLAGVDGVSTENRIRILRLIENMTGGTALVESMHGAGFAPDPEGDVRTPGQDGHEEADGQETGRCPGRGRMIAPAGRRPHPCGSATILLVRTRTGTPIVGMCGRR